jgi:dipeptidase
MLRVPLTILLLIFFVAPVIGCTTFVVTPGASENGEMYVGHTNDGLGECVLGHNLSEDKTRVVYIPPSDHPYGSKRPVLYDPNAGSENPGGEEILGYIPEVTHTYGYFTSAYGIMNEYQLMAGECTDHAKIAPDAEAGERIFYSSELSNVVLERARTAREAVELAGSLIDTYGYYGNGETLIFADPSEAWVIEMCGGNLSETESLWVAEKVPDGTVFAASNIFRIREIEPDNPDILYSKNLFEVAEKNGWWSAQNKTLDWLSTVSNGEYSHPYYSLSRIWSIYNRISPSQNFSPYVEDSFSREYPFSVSPDHPLNETEIFSIFRDHYEGTVFDLTTGIAAGPYGDPYRIRGKFDSHTDFKDGEIRPGAWPRPISAYYCAYSYVTESRRELPYPVGGLCWFGFAQPSETCYTPLYAGTNTLPYSFENGNRSRFNRESAWWSFNFVTNWARIQYSYIFPEIKEEQQKHENLFLSRQAVIEEEALEILNREGEDACREYLTSYTVDTAEDLVSSWWNLSDSLVVSYTNGGIFDPVSKSTTYPGYPDWWYQDAGYQYGPRIYDVEDFDSIPDLVYVNETVYTTPGSEYEYILKHQTAENCS